MDEPSTNPWVYIGECPVCVNGIARVRTCSGGSEVHFLAVCDECEAVWTEPDTASEKQFADPEDPRCPICSAPLFGPQSHWSLPDELASTDWAPLVIFAWPSAEATADDEEEPRTE